MDDAQKLHITQTLSYKVFQMYKHFGWKEDSQRDWKRAVEIVETNLIQDPTGATLNWVVDNEEDSTRTE